jgi:hypothetical protein
VGVPYCSSWTEKWIESVDEVKGSLRQESEGGLEDME